MDGSLHPFHFHIALLVDCFNRVPVHLQPLYLYSNEYTCRDTTYIFDEQGSRNFILMTEIWFLGVFSSLRKEYSLQWFVVRLPSSHLLSFSPNPFRFIHGHAVQHEELKAEQVIEHTLHPKRLADFQFDPRLFLRYSPFHCVTYTFEYLSNE